MGEQVAVGSFETGVGTFGAAVTARGLGCIALPGDATAACERWAARWMPRAEIVRGADGIREVAEAIRAYLAGRLRDFHLPLDLRGSPFQVAVWEHLCTIPYGQTRSYAQVAAAIGRPSAVRAVGAANGANPIAVVVPCHRVIGSGGTLTGYGGGLGLKAHLVELEGIRLRGQRLAGGLPLPGLEAPPSRLALR